MTVSTLSLQHRVSPIVNYVLLGLGGLFLLACVGWLQGELDRRQDRAVVQIEGLAQLPKGEYLKPALLGYHHLGADLLWLRLVQVVGKKRNSADEYEWIYHALDVITTLDPQYAYAYYAGGVTLGDLANRPDLGNRLLEKGLHANPDVWNIPFFLGTTIIFCSVIQPRGQNTLCRRRACRTVLPIYQGSPLGWRRRQGILTRPWCFLRPVCWRRKIHRRENPWRTG